MRLCLAGLAILLILLISPAFPTVEIYQVSATAQTPAWIRHTLNCAADVTIEIHQSGCAECTPVRTVSLPGQSRGKRQYLWNGLRDDGTPAPEGVYRAEITALSNQTQWDPIIGLFKNDDWTHEYAPRPLPDCPNSEGFYGIAINRNAASPYYGRIYVSHKVQKHIFLYDPDGEFIGQMDDSAVTWGASAPWDVSIAEDDYVYVDDRTNRVIHCFTPDGQHVSVSPQINYSKAIYAHRDASGVTSVFQTGGPTIRKITLAADHVTWGTACNAFTPGTNNLATLGIWVSPDLATIDNPVVDAEIGRDGTYLWVTRMVDSTIGKAINKVRVSDGVPYNPPDADYDVITWALMCCTDGVGNVGVTFGKSTSSWAQYYWGIFAEPGISQARKTTSEFVVTARELSTIRSMPAGAEVEVYGIVTGKWTDFFYVEDTERQVGVRVQWSDVDAETGNLIKVTGLLGTNRGERVITPTSTPVVIAAGAEPPQAYDLRTRDIGGAAYDAANPGVTDGRGALNVGLRVRLQGMVTVCDPGGRWFYLWDGANRTDLAVGDGTGYLGVRVESALACVPWVDWVDVTGVVSADSAIVPGSVIPIVLATSASEVTSFDQTTAEPNTALAMGWNLISLPAAPAATGDGGEFTAKPWDAFQVLSPGKDPADMDGRLYRWESCTGGIYMWDLWSELETHGPFGGLALGDGYWFSPDAAWPVSYSARLSNLDQWMGICSPGWMIIGQPKDHGTALADVRVHDGGAVYSMYDAILANSWIDCAGYWWDNRTQGLMDIGIPDCWAGTDTLMPWHGYWLQAFRGDMALIVP